MTAAVQTATPDPVLRRSASPREAVGGKGAWIFDSTGTNWLDASSSVFVSILGANPHGLADRVGAAMSELQFAYSGNFSSSEEDALARALIDKAPEGITKVWLTTSGSTANESALKMARQYHLSRGNSQKTKVISRWHSYHGSTIGAMSLSGSGPRRRPYEPYLLDVPHVPPPDCYRCPWGARPESCALACADAFEKEILAVGSEYISAVMVEPVAGAPLGALVSPPGYLRRIRDICDRHDVLMIADEIVSGMCRTGEWFAVQHDDVVPDMLTLAKGLGGGYVPIGAVLLHDRINAVLEGAGVAVNHGESFTGHRIMGAAGQAVIEFIDTEGLADRVASKGPALEADLTKLTAHPLVGIVRGRGFLYGVELVKDKTERRPFSRDDKVSERVAEAAARRHVLFQTGNAGADGQDGDTIMIAPPYVTSDADLKQIVSVLSDALDEVAIEIEAGA